MNRAKRLGRSGVSAERRWQWFEDWRLSAETPLRFMGSLQLMES